MSGLTPLPGHDARALDSALRTCEEIAARGRSNLYVVSQFLGDRRRYESFIAMYSVMRVIDDLVDAVPNVETLDRKKRDRLEGELKQWWNRIEDAYAGNPRREPLDVALASALAVFPIPKPTWRSFLRAMHDDLCHDRFETPESFLEYAEGAAAAPTTIYVFLLCAQPTTAGSLANGRGTGIARYEVADAGDGFDYLFCGRELGIFAYLAHILRDVAKDLRIGERGRIYIPATDLAEAGLSEDELRLLIRTGLDDPRWRKLVATLVRRARRFEVTGVREARARFPVMEPDCRFILALIISLYRDLLDAIEADPASVLGDGMNHSDEDRLATVRRAATEAAYRPPGYEDLLEAR